ncbi:DUF3274 domain-containing protein [Chitinivorax sp. B]|uniref:T6SS effector phospholipase Tle3 domain-containing protein n=1 Tax=Chitinivorax sp. B TaxID=2502235 RepID=UPI0010F56223|nr:DUF3274 domain-containing protein [Chitinivorax sp. B]
MSHYPKKELVIASDTAVTQCQRESDKTVSVPADLPGNIIVIHGVNDVGTGYGTVERGLCTGLIKRLYREDIVPGEYRDTLTQHDREHPEEDPDAVFFKRKLDETSHTPIIPFYWGFREIEEEVNKGELEWHGQSTDRYGNRLDKDYSKGGGPFANATTSLPDMWNKGNWGLWCRAADRVAADPLRPVLSAPGRMYMVLAAKRLAALISMIRDYHVDETVSLVAHSQGCMVSLLAQAFLLHKGLRPADTLVLNNPPYSLEDSGGLIRWFAQNTGEGEDASMAKHYHKLKGGQTLHARLETLANIVKGVFEKRHTEPALTTLTGYENHGIVGATWEPDKDRDNRGKVYLYFGPEDMTVGLPNVKGIGWQGVPDAIKGSRLDPSQPAQQNTMADPDGPIALSRITREALPELGTGFRQRVFSVKQRKHPQTGQLGMNEVGLAPHDFVLREKGEDDHAHVTENAGNMRQTFPEYDPKNPDKRDAIRRITGEALPKPFKPSLYDGAANSIPAPDDKKKRVYTGQTEDAAKQASSEAEQDKIRYEQGRWEQVDAIDAQIALTSAYGRQQVWDLVDGQEGSPSIYSKPERQPVGQNLYTGWVVAVANNKVDTIQKHLNFEKPKAQQTEKVYEAYQCLEKDKRTPTGKLLIRRDETPEEIQRRFMTREVSERSFHGAIFNGQKNHEMATAYDVSIGSGRASTDKAFHAYLCVVADWRLKIPDPTKEERPGILTWPAFQEKFADYWQVEEPWRRELIKGNSDYYSSGELPACVKPLYEEKPAAVISESVRGWTFEEAQKAHVIPEPPPTAATPSPTDTSKPSQEGQA